MIDAINTDVPYDRFITEQLAGDLLPAKDEAERARLLIATGFLAIGPKGLGESNKQQFAADVADEQLDAVTRAVMASSIACARCHDHKTDPFSMEGNWIDSENNNDGDLIPLPRLPGQVIPNRSIGADRVKKLKADLERMDQEEKAEKEMARRAKAEGKKLEIDYYEALKKAIGRYWTRGGIEGELERVDELGQALPLCMGVKDAQLMVDSPLYVRGELAHPG